MDKKLEILSVGDFLRKEKITSVGKFVRTNVNSYPYITVERANGSTENVYFSKNSRVAANAPVGKGLFADKGVAFITYSDDRVSRWKFVTKQEMLDTDALLAELDEPTVLAQR